jgi:tetratricopeptide (TPR) repeat protein
MVRLNAWDPLNASMGNRQLACLVLLATILVAGCSSAPTQPTQPTPSAAPELPGSDPTSTGRPPGPEHSLTLAMHDQANSARLRGDFDTAIATLERAIRIDPDAPELWLLLSQVNLDAGDPAAAEQLARKALQFVGHRSNLEQQAWTLIDSAQRQLADHP